MKNKTTKTHHLYYGDLAEKVTDDEIAAFMKRNKLTPEIIKREYKKDPFFRFMDFKIFDRNIHPAAFCQPELLETINSCLWKWVFVFRVLKAEPVFIDSANYFNTVKV